MDKNTPSRLSKCSKWTILWPSKSNNNIDLETLDLKTPFSEEQSVEWRFGTDRERSSIWQEPNYAGCAVTMSESKRGQCWKTTPILCVFSSKESSLQLCEYLNFCRKINDFKQANYVSYVIEEFKELIKNCNNVQFKKVVMLFCNLFLSFLQ